MNNKKQMLILSIVIIFVFSLLIIVYYFKDNNKTIIMNEKKINNNNAISIMLETGFETGVYELSESTAFPSSGYILNTTRSGCENGSTLSYDDTMNKVVIKGNISDKCYIYFDSLPPSIDLAIPDCPNAVTSWDRGLQQLAVTSFSTSTLNCTLEEETVNNVLPFNTYIISLSDSIQGDGKVIHETFDIPNYSTPSIISLYGTTPIYFQNTYRDSISQTNVDSYWTFNNGTFTSNPSKFTISGTSNYYHVYAQVPEEGYYRICYTIEQSVNSNNNLNFYKNTTLINYVSSSTSSQVGESCNNMGYFQSGDYINISERGYSGTSSPIMSFRIEKGGSSQIDTGYRYEGEDPNNYIMFNNELWRIIGVFSTEYDDNSDEIVDDTEFLVKIIRDESIGGFAWDKRNYNSWYGASLKNLLKYAYYDWNRYKSDVSTYCYGYSNEVPSKCDFSTIGIADKYRSFIKNAKWYLGGGGKAGYTGTSANSVYQYERDPNAVYGSNYAFAFSPLGLMYESDYLYGVLASDCARTTSHTYYNTNSCAGKNWLFSQGVEWIITHYSLTSGSSWYIYYTGYIENNNVFNGFSVRPVLYLSSLVYKISGTGSIADPYIIGM